MATLAELTKALDALDPLALDEPGVVEWAQKQITEAKGDTAHLQHVRAQIDAAQAAFAKGATSFRVKAYAPDRQAQSPLQAASAKLGEALAGKNADAPDNATDAASEENIGEVDDATEESEQAAKGTPARKAAPESVGKGYFEVDDDSVWGSPLGASMSKIKLDPNTGKVYART